MAVAFSGVTAITIPEGDVLRITETSSGRVLWEKITEKVYEFTVRASNSVGSHDRTYRLVVKQ